MTPIVLLTGFLGSGKTTVLNHLVRQPEMADTLVIINEFGEIALDHALVAHSTENLVMEMSSGCLCCTIRGDLVKTLKDIHWRFSRDAKQQFRRVLIETTGLADPAPIIHTLMTDLDLASRYRMDGVVTTVDMSNAMQTLDKQPEATKQIAMADALLLTKGDLVDQTQQKALLRRLHDLNPAAPPWQVCQGEIDPSKLLNLGLYDATGKSPDVLRWLREEAYVEPAHDHSHDHDHHHGHSHDHEHHHHDVNRHDDRIQAFCFRVEAPISPVAFSAWLEVLMMSVGEGMLRVKGILNIQGNTEPMVLHGVQDIFHPIVKLPAWPSDDHGSRIVFITRDIDREAVEKIFSALQDMSSTHAESLVD